MPKANIIQTAFNAGELSPLLGGRVDISKYKLGVETTINMLPHVQGPISKRPGFQFIAETKTSAKASRLISFEFSTIQAYILEFGELYIRFYKDKGQITSGGSPYEIVSPYDDTELREIKYIQSADVMYLCHPSYAPRKLSRTGHTAWTLSAIDYGDGPYLPENSTSTTITPSATTGSITLTASAALFSSTHVGSVWRIKHGSTWGYVKVTAYTDSTHVTADVKTTLGGTSAVTTWREGAWSDYQGWPSTLAFHEERLYFAGTSKKPQTIWGSKSGDYENFKPEDTITDSGPLTYTIASNQVNAIRWLSSSRLLMIGTSGGECRMSAANTSEAITPTNISVRQDTAYGSENLMPQSVGDVVLFVQRHGRKIREIAYSFEKDGYVSPDMTRLSEHISKPGIIETAYQREPDSTLWAVRSDGVLLSMIYERAEDVIGWSKHTTDGLFESVACIPGTDQTEVWAIINRTINGAAKRYVECLKDMDWGDDQEDCFFVDSGLTYDSTPVTTISGLDHLEGETVAVLADGASHPNCVVSSGDITLERSASVVQAGLPYTPYVKTMRLEGGSALGSSQGSIKRIHELKVRLYKTLGIKVGPDDDNLETVYFRNADDAMDSPPALFTGDKVLDFRGEYERDGQIVITQDQPLPLTLMALMAQVTVMDG